MARYPLLPLLAANDIEPLKSWEDVTSPHDLVLYLIRMAAVDPNQLLQFTEIVVGPDQPSGADRNKLWLKNTDPFAVGIFNGNTYKLIYEYPPNVPLIWTKARSEFPSYLTELNDGQLTSYGLTKPPSDAFYFMLIV